VNGSNRCEAMARRVALAVQHAGIAAEQRQRLHRLLSTVLEQREARFADEHHPDLLHPGRNALILVEDLGVREPDILAAAIAFDSMQPPASLGAAELVDLEETGGGPLVEQLRVLPSDRAELVEALVVASDAVRLVALVDLLDHARHLHLRERSQWQASHELVETVYLPVASRSHPTLERRLRTWARAFAEKYLRQ
jgi:hypothetical protein